MTLTIKKIKHVNKLTSIANIDSLVDALGPKCLETISIHIKDNHDTNIPPSIAIISDWQMVLFANKFIDITDIVNKHTTTAGMLLSNSFVSRSCSIIHFFIKKLLCFVLYCEGFRRRTPREKYYIFIYYFIKQKVSRQLILYNVRQHYFQFYNYLLLNKHAPQQNQKIISLQLYYFDQ